MIIMRKYSLFIAFWTMGTLAISAQETADTTVTTSMIEPQSYLLTLNECLQYAFGNSYERQNLALTEKSAAESTKQARNERRPNVSFSASESARHTGSSDQINFGGNVGLNGGVAIYQGGAISKNIKRSQMEEESTRLRTAKYDNSLSIEILNAYLAVLKNRETLKSKESIVETSREQAEMGRKKYDAGKLLESDCLVLEAQYASNRMDTLDARIARTTNLLTLKKLMSMDPSAQLDLVEPDTTAIDAMAMLPAQEECVSKAMQSMPEMRLSENAIEIAEIQTKITKAAYRPTISASAGLSASHMDFDEVGKQMRDNFTQQVGISLSMPIYDRGQTKSRLAQNRYSKQQAELDKAQTELEIKQTVINQYQNVRLAYERYKITKQRCEAYKAVLSVFNAKFNVGSVVITDLLQQQDNYINSINEYVQAKYAFILNRKILDVYMGDGVRMD